MTMSPLKVRTVSVALPSPKVARMLWLLTVAAPAPRVVAVARRSPPMVSGSSDRIDPLKLFAFSSKPGRVGEHQPHRSRVRR